MNPTSLRLSALAFAIASGALLSSPVAAAGRDTPSPAADTRLSSRVDAAAYQLRIVGPGGFLIERTFLKDEPMLLDQMQGDITWQAGQYFYEIVPIAGLMVRDADEQKASASPTLATTSGTFRVHQGRILVASMAKGGPPIDRDEGNQPSDQVIPDDLIVQGSICTGFDCVDAESFGFDTLRLKENNTRIKFEDTSTGAFPATDWQLTANDSASGGANRFSIEDVTASTVPFTVTGAAPSNSIFVSSTGRVGFGTSAPVLDLHVSTGNTPAIRLEQTAAGGFTAQTWDVGGNEANFFVRDVTSGSRLPFRIRPGAPTSSIDISAAGNVGIGTASPTQSLHVAGADGSTTILVQESSGTVQGRTLLQLINNGPARFKLNDASAGVGWVLNAAGNEFRVSLEGAAATPFTFQNDGDLIITGALSQGSSRDSKHNFEPVDAAEVLQRLRSLEVTRWSYRNDDDQSEHIGPMAQDFHAAFGLGPSDDRLAPLDVNGVTLLAVQELARKLDEKDQRIADLEASIRELQGVTASLTAHLAATREANRMVSAPASPPAASGL